MHLTAVVDFEVLRRRQHYCAANLVTTRAEAVGSVGLRPDSLVRAESELLRLVGWSRLAGWPKLDVWPNLDVWLKLAGEES